MHLKNSQLVDEIVSQLTDNWQQCLMSEPISSYSDLKANQSGQVILLMEILCMRLQHDLCRALEKLEADSGSSTRFIVDKWFKQDPESVEAGLNQGGGVTCVIENGKVIDKGGVNISKIYSKLNANAAVQMKQRGIPISDSVYFSVVGISCVLHPVNPFVPTTHFNFRYFQLSNNVIDGKEHNVWWFGGGSDLTPYYLIKEDAVHFHAQLKQACDPFNAAYFPTFKKWCDEYFRITHRNECRGVGGIFFDDLNTDKYSDQSVDSLLEFVRSCMSAIIPCYIPIVEKRKDLSYTEKHQEWQLIRRGRYVEFNLVYDRGTKFGLCVPGSRVESILMSLPNLASWKYCHQPEPSTEEHELLQVLQNPIDWV